jgi:hypothetical protein
MSTIILNQRSIVGGPMKPTKLAAIDPANAPARRA